MKTSNWLAEERTKYAYLVNNIQYGDQVRKKEKLMLEQRRLELIQKSKKWDDFRERRAIVIAALISKKA